jgi:nicotinate-nucleotide adenylyltransferase
MLEAAVEGDPRFVISPAELQRGGVSYSIDTIRALQAERPKDRFHFIIGGDTVFELRSWKSIYELLELCTFITMGRPGFSEREITSETTGLEAPWPLRLAEKLTIGHLIEVSSSDVRMRVAEGLSIRYLVPDAVQMYICEHQLYLR